MGPLQCMHNNNIITMQVRSISLYYILHSNIYNNEAKAVRIVLLTTVDGKRARERLKRKWLGTIEDLADGSCVYAIVYGCYERLS